MTYFIISGFSMSSSSNCNQQSMEMRNRGAINKTAGTLMSFGPVHDKYTKGIDISQVFFMYMNQVKIMKIITHSEDYKSQEC